MKNPIKEITTHGKDNTLNIGNTIVQLHMTRVLAIAFQAFIRKTKISPSIIYHINQKQELECNLSFAPVEPNEEQYKLLFQEIKDAEQFLYSQNLLLEEIPHYETLNQMIFRHKEILAKLIEEKKKPI